MKRYQSVLNHRSFFENHFVRQNKFLAAAIPALIGGGAAAAGSSLINGAMNGAGKGANFNAYNGVQAQDVTNQMNRTSGALDQQQALLAALQGQNGITNQSNVYDQLQGVASGQGPNPAQAMLAQATGANVANQAALMAGQRGASANAGLIARQAGMQGGALQQQAAGQGATMQANQSLNALGQLGNLSTQQVAQQQAAQNALLQGNLNEQQLRQNALEGQNQTNAGIQGQIARGQIAGNAGLVSGIGTAGTMLGQGIASALTPKPSGISGVGPIANGNDYAANLPQKAHGGIIDGPGSFVGRHLKGMPQLARGGKVPALVSPGEEYLSPEKVEAVAKGKASPLKAGEKIPGKAKVEGDSKKNDTVKKTLDAGGIVIPRSIVMDKDDPAGKAAKFVEAILAKQGMKRQ